MRLLALTGVLLAAALSTGSVASASTVPKLDCSAVTPDACSITQETVTPDKVTIKMRYTAVMQYSAVCTPEQTTNCLWQVYDSTNVTGAPTTNNGGVLAATSTTCPWGSFHTDHFNYFQYVSKAFTTPTTSITCTSTWVWNPEQTTPTNFATQLVESDANQDFLTAHGFSVGYPVPPITASFTAEQVPGVARTVKFTDTTALPPGLSFFTEEWSYDDNGTTQYGFAGPDGTWTEQFPSDGVYDIDFNVTDSAEQMSSAEGQVIVVTPASGPSLTVVEALGPKGDPGRFDLAANGKVLKKAAANGSYGTTGVKPGTYTVSQKISSGQLGNYGVNLTCASRGKPLTNVNATSGKVKVAAGSQVICTFTDTDTHSAHCDVPDLTGMTFGAAQSALSGAGCDVGKVTAPKQRKHPLAKMIVAGSSPAAFGVLAHHAKVALTLMN